jgi:hypothetical protein
MVDPSLDNLEAAFSNQLYFQLSSRPITEAELRQVVVEAGFGID